MNAQHERILRIIAELAGGDELEVDEFSVATACGAIPEQLPRHAWVNHPCRGELLRVLTCLDQGKLIYVTKRGYWGLHLTQHGRDQLATLDAAPAEDRIIEEPPVAVDGATDDQTTAWEAPRVDLMPGAPRHDHFYSTLALAIAGLGALLIFAFGQSTYSPLARDSAAASGAATTPTAPIILPTPPVYTPTAPAAVVATTAVKRTLVVANTGGEGVFLRQAPKTGARIAAFTEKTVLVEIGPQQSIDGMAWLHVRTPDGTEGFLPAQYTAVKE